MARPEKMAPPELFYNEKEAGKYTENSRIITVQNEMAQRCVELLSLPDDEKRLILDIGCGSGLSGDVLTEAGHEWIGLDIAQSMLDVAVTREVAGDLMLNDMGQGFGFRAGTFDGAVSVSALQWLCYSDKKDHKASKRLSSFFASLYRCLRRGARAALQVYPENSEQLELMTTTAMKCGFTGGLVVDFPNSTKAKKYFLCLFAGVDSAAAKADLPTGRGVAGGGASHRSRQGGAGVADSSSAAAAGGATFESRRSSGGKKRGGKVRLPVKSRAWTLAKKDSQRRRGQDVRPDSKYSGRKRSKFRV